MSAFGNSPLVLGGNALSVASGTSPVGTTGITAAQVAVGGTVANTIKGIASGTAGQLLAAQGAGVDPIWVTATGGAGDMNGPASSTDNAIVRFDGVGGKTVQNSTITVSDTGVIAAASGSLTLTTPDIGAATGTSLVLSGNLTNNGATALFQNGAADPTVHIKATANTFNPKVRFEGFDRNFYLGALDSGADAVFNLSLAAALSAPILSINPATSLTTLSGNLTVSGTGASSVAGTWATGAPTGGAGAWKLGIANVVSPTSPNRTITIDIGGTLYYLAAKTSND